MKQSILKQGDMVKYHNENSDLTELGFELGQVYEVRESKLYGVYIEALTSAACSVLILPNGTLTDATDYFSKVKGLVTLPKGISN